VARFQFRDPNTGEPTDAKEPSENAFTFWTPDGTPGPMVPKVGAGDPATGRGRGGRRTIPRPGGDAVIEPMEA
jgi:hypothetical protein